MINRIILEGRVAKDITLLKTKNGTSVVKFDLAVPRPRSDEGTDFFTIVAWKSLAEALVNNCGKGSIISIDGKLRNDSYTDSDNVYHHIIRVYASEVHFLSLKKPEAIK